MMTTLSGENGFMLQSVLKGLINDFIDTYSDIALERLDGQEASFERMQESIQSLPFLASRKMVVLRTPGVNKQFAEHIAEILDDIPETTELIIVEPKLDKRSSYYKQLKKITSFQEYNELDREALISWLLLLVKERNGSMSRADAAYAIERIGLNQQLLSQEIEKLLLFNLKISRETIDSLTDASPQSTIFELLEAAFNGDSALALSLYSEQRHLKVEPQQIIAMLAWQLHIIAMLKVAGDRSPQTIASEAKLNPFVVRKSATVARSLKLPELKRLITNLLAIDARLKRESVDADEALQNYLLNLSQQKRPAFAGPK